MTDDELHLQEVGCESTPTGERIEEGLVDVVQVATGAIGAGAGLGALYLGLRADRARRDELSELRAAQAAELAELRRALAIERRHTFADEYGLDALDAFDEAEGFRGFGVEEY